MFEINRQGCTRVVLLTKNYAFKFPNFLNGWSLFLHGLLANMQEAGWSKLLYKKDDSMGLCPVLFNLGGGFMIVMKKLPILTLEQWQNFDFESFKLKKAAVPVENKPDSFGWLNGEIVAVDYGN